MRICEDYSFRVFHNIINSFLQLINDNIVRNVLYGRIEWLVKSKMLKVIIICTNNKSHRKQHRKFFIVHCLVVIAFRTDSTQMPAEKPAE